MTICKDDSQQAAQEPTEASELTYAIETRDLGRRFGGKWAVKGLDLRVPRGCVYGFLGVNGAGKSTTIRMLMGLLTRSEGSASVLGFDPAKDEVAIKSKVGYVPDSPNFYEWMSVAQLLAFVAHYRKGRWDTQRAEHLLKVFGVSATQKLSSLSKGQRAKVNLTLALAFHPELLILDEPTGGLDPLARRQFVEGVLSEYMEKEGKTILISSHLVNEISGLVDYVGILRGGKLVRQEPVERLLTSVKRLRLLYEAEPPAKEAFPGALRYRAEGREVLLTLDRFDTATAASLQKSTQAVQGVVEDLNVEEIFVELESASLEEEQ